MVANFAKKNNLVQCTVQEDTKIYYSIHSISRFPFLSPIKYSTASFKAGEVIYIDSFNIPLESHEYVNATDGKKAGFITTSSLQQ